MSGDAAFVVHDAFEVMSHVPNLFSLTDMRIVAPGTVPASSFAGALITTFLAPQSRWNFAFSNEVNKPVDSTTTSTPSSFHGSFVVSFSEINFTGTSSIKSPCSLWLISYSHFLYTVSYCKRYASDSSDPRSFTATISISGRSHAILRNARPIRPKPLIATLIFFIRSIIPF